VIASIRGATPSELAYVARKAERMGVDALQLDLYAPIGPVLAELYTSPDLIAALVSAVKKKVSLPLMVRLPHYLADNKKFLRALETAGADGICTIESIRGISGVDIVNARPLMPTHGGYTGTNVRPITLSAIAALSQNSNLPVAATGGFDAAENVIEAIELGATTVMLGSALLGGYGIITETVRRLEEWLEKNGYGDIGALRGAALQYLRSYEELHER
jgi:dihydroorotate oxidase